VDPLIDGCGEIVRYIRQHLAEEPKQS